jgi:pilus assembly protein CpaF
LARFWRADADSVRTDPSGAPVTAFDEIFSADASTERMWQVLRDPQVSQIVINRHDRVFFTSQGVVREMPSVFPSPEAYNAWLAQLCTLTDLGPVDLSAPRTSVLEGSFDPARTDLHGSIHITTVELTRDQPGLTVRKQPRKIVTVDEMVAQQMMSVEMRGFLEQAVRGRSNILISGGSGVGKTTLVRALAWFFETSQRVVVAEEIDELHLDDRLPNVMSLTTFTKTDDDGRIIRRVELEDLVREALRMRADRIIVGETRGKESYGLLKAANSGHDGSLTTLHADSSAGAVRQLITYVMEAGVTEEVARDQVAQAFHLVVQVARGRMGRRVVTEITEIEPVREGNEIRRNTIFQYDPVSETFKRQGHPSKRMLTDWSRYGVNYEWSRDSFR